jgi:hypothetical protein
MKNQKENSELVVSIGSGLNRDTGFWEFGVYISSKPTEENSWPDYVQNKKYFLIRPSPSGRLIIMAYDYESDRSDVPQKQPEIIDDYIHPYHARKRVEKEVKQYTLKIMKENNLRLMTPSGIKSLEQVAEMLFY